ncbi:MAG: glutathione peroxidase [Pseudomonadota bacterium]
MIHRRLFFTVLAAASALSATHHSTLLAADQRTAHGFDFTSIEGDPLPLSQFAGKAILVVNTASRCGFTYQYAGLQELWSAYRARGLVVLGVPSNDFRQELKSAEAVKEFCEVNFDIDFPMTDLVSVKGAAAHPFYRWAASLHGAPSWNFNKYLVDPEGQLIARFGSSTAPESATLIRAIETVLPAKS